MALDFSLTTLDQEELENTQKKKFLTKNFMFNQTINDMCVKNNRCECTPKIYFPATGE